VKRVKGEEGEGKREKKRERGVYRLIVAGSPALKKACNFAHSQHFGGRRLLSSLYKNISLSISHPQHLTKSVPT